MKNKKWYDNGIQFECQGSGKCCSSRGEYGHVYLTKQDRRNMAKALGISTIKFTKQYCNQQQGVFFLKESIDSEDCLFLENNKCRVYEGRPSQCRTWPFWPDTMKAKTWNKEVKAFCPGIGKGKIYSKEEVDKILEEEIASEKELFSHLE